MIIPDIFCKRFPAYIYNRERNRKEKEMLKSKKHYFNCMELLMIIAVFVIGSALVFPVLGSAQTAAKSVSCQDNLQICIKAALMYANEHDGKAVLKYGDSS